MAISSELKTSVTTETNKVKSAFAPSFGIAKGVGEQLSGSVYSKQAAVKGPPPCIPGGDGGRATPLAETKEVVGGGGSRGNLDEIKQAWGDFLEQIGKDLNGWDWFVTFTFRDPSNPKYPNWTQPGWQYAHTALRKWNDAICTNRFFNGAVSSVPYWIACMEYQRWRGQSGVPGMNRGVPHWHLLVGGTGQGTENEERRMDWVDWWFENYGLARILPYRQELGARFYLGKYLVKEMADVVASPQLSLKHRQLCLKA